MADVYTQDIGAAKALIGAFGAQCQWQKPRPVAGGDPGYPTEGSEPSPVPCEIVFFSSRDVAMMPMAFRQSMKGTDVPESAELGLMQGGVPFVPELTDTITRADGRVYSVKKIDAVAPNGTPVLYYLLVQS